MLEELPKEKWCTACEKNHPLDQFSKHKGGKYGVASICKKKHSERTWKHRKANYDNQKEREYWMVKKYDITIEQYAELLEQQGGVCAICKQKVFAVRASTNQAYSLVVDHDHSTGAVRGLLCTNCNTALGLLKEDPNRILALLDYLQKFSV